MNLQKDFEQTTMAEKNKNKTNSDLTIDETVEQENAIIVERCSLLNLVKAHKRWFDETPSIIWLILFPLFRLKIQHLKVKSFEE